MVRYLLAVAGVVMLVSAPAFAEMGDMGGTTKKVITRTHDGDTLVDEKLGSRQRYGLPMKRGIKINCVAVINDSKRLTQ